MANVHVFCFLASYACAFALEVFRLLRKNSWVRTVCLGFGFAGLLAQSIYLVVRSRQADLPPLLSSDHDWLLVLAWTAVVFYLILALLESDVPIGLFVLPVVLLLIGASYFVDASPTPALAASARNVSQDGSALRGWGMLHASFLVFGIVGVIVGLIFSLMYLVQHRRLKHKQAGQRGFSLPSLATLARWNWWSVIVSIPLLTLGLLTGVRLIFLSREMPGPVSFSDPLVVGSIVVWLVMIAFFGWLLKAEHVGGKQIALRTIWAFGFLLVTLLGLQILTGGHKTQAQARTASRPISTVVTVSAAEGAPR